VNVSGLGLNLSLQIVKLSEYKHKFGINYNFTLYNHINFPMKRYTTGIIAFLLFTVAAIAQQGASIYANMDAADAVLFKELYPAEMTILASKNKQAAVILSKEIIHKIHDNVKTHGPHYIFR